LRLGYRVVSESVIPDLKAGDAYHLRVTSLDGTLRVHVHGETSDGDQPLAELPKLSSTSGHLRFGVELPASAPEPLEVEYVAARRFGDRCDVTVDANGTAWFSQIQDGSLKDGFLANWESFFVHYNTTSGALVLGWPAWIAALEGLGAAVVLEGENPHDHTIYGIKGLAFRPGTELLQEYQGEVEGEFVH